MSGYVNVRFEVDSLSLVAGWYPDRMLRVPNFYSDYDERDAAINFMRSLNKLSPPNACKM